MKIEIKKFDIDNFNINDGERKGGCRVGIFGSPGSGKSYSFINKIFPAINSMYHLIIFVMEYDQNLITQYKNAIPKNRFIMQNGKKTKVPIVHFKHPNTIDDIESYINMVYKFQKNTQNKYNVLIVFDDVMKIQGLEKSSVFTSCFTNFRHMKASVFLLIQSFSATVINTKVLSSLSHALFFRINKGSFINFICKEYIEPSLIKLIDKERREKKIEIDYPKDDKMKKITQDIYRKYISDYEYGNGLIFDVMKTDIYYFN